MATNPITLLQGTTANATDVETKVNPLYSSIDNSNISASAGIVFSKLDSATVASVSTSQTLSNKTFSTNTVFAAGASISATQNLYLDGGTDTYFEESSDGVVDLYANAAQRLRVNSTTFQVLGVDIYMPTTKKLYFDGGTDTYMTEASDNVIQIITNSTSKLQIGASGVAVQNVSLSVPAAQNLYLDGGSNTYFVESSADVVQLYTNAALRLQIDSTGAFFSNGLSTAATTKLWLDGGGDTYWIESSANTVNLFVGGSSRCEVSSTGWAFTNDIKLTAATKLYLDGGSNTYISETSADTIAVFAGGTSTLSIEYNAGSPFYGSGNSDSIVGATKKVRLDGSSSGNTHISETSADTVTFTCGGTSTAIMTSSGVQLVSQDPPAANVMTNASFARAWVNFSVTGGGITLNTFTADYNVDTASCSAAGGVATVAWDRDFATSSYTAVCTGYTTANVPLAIKVAPASGNSCVFTPYSVATAAAHTGDWHGQCIVFGAQ